ncbi:MAG TPA: TonB-dependent receptor [Thioploca sp.]|nr:TonB-dependent receptor [Thioploca sp.]
MKTKIYSLVVVLLLSVSAFAQSYEVSGTVSDNSNQPLPGVSVVVKGTTTGTSTDFDGKYKLQVNKGDVLVFTFVGFESQEITMDGSATVNVTLKSGVALDEVVVIGSRNKNRTAVDTPVPVDILDVKELTASAPQISVNAILNYAAPSFTSNTQTISDGTDHIDPASLRGLGPDQVLVLINGKRRHKSSLINVNGTFGRGSVGTDMNAIPSHAIDRIEILRDGAAAQYGSDAIAGVINIVLKKSTDLSVILNAGTNLTNVEDDVTGLSDNKTDGERLGVALNYGLPIGEKGGYINFTGSFDFRGRTNRMLEWEGSIFNAYNAIENVARVGGTNFEDLSFAQIQFLGANVSHFSPQLQTDIAAATSIADLRSILNVDVTDAELAARGLKRSDFNMNVGQSELRNAQFFANMSIPVSEDTEIYAFGGVGFRGGNATGFYRLPNQNRTYTPAYPNGFLPQIHSNIIDKSLAVGIRGKLGDWDVDFSNTWGTNSFNFNIQNSLNASLGNASPFQANAGGFAYTENTINFDVSRFFEDQMEGLNIAFGAEFRLENYEIVAGSEESYAQYNTLGNVHDPTDPNSIVPTDFFGRSRPGGIQVFPGFRPDNELNEYRNSIAGYLDIEADITEAFLLTGAVRYENYSDFGETVNGKISTRLKVGENFNIRGGLQTGFRAPSLHQIHFNSTSTLFIDGDPFEVGVFPNTSRIARILGINKLKEETSFGATFGFTAKVPSANLKITVDGYILDIDDRVIETGQFTADGNPELEALFAQANAERVGFFANAVDTETKGVDVVVNHNADVSDKVSISSTLAFTISDTEIQKVNVPRAIANAGLTERFFDPTSRVYLESAVPRVKGNLSHNIKIGDKWNIFLRNSYFGEVTEATNNVASGFLTATETTANSRNISQIQVNSGDYTINRLYDLNYAGKIVTDLSFGYNLDENTKLTVGANNLLDVYPDANDPAFRSSGRFIYSRRSQQFGTNGRFVFARLSFTLK